MRKAKRIKLLRKSRKAFEIRNKFSKSQRKKKRKIQRESRRRNRK